MDYKQSTLTCFHKVTSLPENESIRILEKNDWQLEESFRSYYSTAHEEVPQLAPICGLFTKNASSVPLQGTRVFANVVDFVADVNVSQRFINTSDRPLEVTLKFRQYKAVLCGFEIQMDGKKIKGECKEKEEAQNKYDDAIASGHTATIASSSDDSFNIMIGNLAPGAQCIVTIKYLMELEIRGDYLVLSFPVLSLPVTPINNSPPHEYKTQVPDGLEVEVTFDMSHSRILNIDCYSHSIKTKIEDKKAYLKGEQLVRGLNFVALVKLEDPHHPTAVLEVTDPGKEAAIMVSMFPERLVTDDDILNEIIFLVDRSGSMSGSRINQAKNALQLFLRALPLGTMFNIWGFGSRYDQIWKQSMKFNEETLSKASNYVSNLDANLGGTEILPPLQNIFSSPVDPNFPRQIFVLTDGEVSNTNQVLSFVKRSCGRSTRVFSFGIGGASEALVSGIARYGNGRAVYISNNTDRIETIVMKQLQDALQPVLKNIEVDWGTLPISKRPVPYLPPPLFDGDLLVLYGYLESGKNLPDKSEICVKGTTGSQQFTWTVSLSTLQPITGTTVHRLTAQDIISNLENTAAEANKHEIIRLAKKWELSSKFTSFVAVSEQDEAVGKEMETVDIQEDTNVSHYLFYKSNSPPSLRSAPSPRSSSQRLSLIQSDIDKANIVMNENIDKLLKRSAMLEDISECSMDLSHQSALFKRRSATPSFGNMFSSLGNAIGEGISSIGSSIGSLFSSPVSDSSNAEHMEEKNLQMKQAEQVSEKTIKEKLIETTNLAMETHKWSTTITLDTFILLQNASGSFVLNADFERHLKMERTDILKGIPSILLQLNDEKKRESIWVSALALVHLKKHYPELVQDWTMLADKTTKFLKREMNTETYLQVIIEAEKFYDKQ